MRELPVRRPQARAILAGKRAERAADRAETDLGTADAFLLIALLLALNVMLRFPGLGAMVTQYNQF